MSGVAAQLLREDLRAFTGYRSARSETLRGEVWLNANEAATASDSDRNGLMRRYPEPQPAELVDALANLYGVQASQVLVGRGSDECIDLLVRAFCAPGEGAIAIASPVFGMYAVCARLHGVRIVDVPLRDDGDGLCVDLPALGDAALAAQARVVFLCSPGNPSGEALALDRIGALAERLAGTAIVAVDEAYGEFSTVPSATALLSTHSNLVVLRTLSKAHALAGARVGCALAAADVIAALRCCQAPYPLAQPVVAAALAALQPATRAGTAARVARACTARELLADGLRSVSGVRRVYASQGNFVLVRFEDADAAFARLLAAGVVVRDMRAMPQLDDALRISVGTRTECRRVLAALGGADHVEDAA